MIKFLACGFGRNDEVLNIELAKKLCESGNKRDIREIVDGMKSKDRAIANDCIKVLYEIGQRKPDYIVEFTDGFIDALSSQNNRMVWGGMTALTCVTPINPEAVFNRLPEILEAYERGSVITVDNCISVLACLCKANEEYKKQIFPFLLEHISNCRPKEMPQHAERISICIDMGNKAAFMNALAAREDELTGSQKSRVMKLIKGLK